MKKKLNPIVSVIMGSESDYPTMLAACELLKQFKIPFETLILSAHRTPDEMRTFATGARLRGIKVIIAGAGGAAHLPGMTAAYTTLPVIGVPIVSKNMNGIDSLYSIVQMPSGVPVATVAIGNALNAGLLAVQILSIENSKIAHSLEVYRENLQKKVQASRAKIKK